MVISFHPNPTPTPAGRHHRGHQKGRTAPAANSSAKVEILVARGGAERARLLAVMASVRDPQPRWISGRKYAARQPFASLQLLAAQRALPVLARADWLVQDLPPETRPSHAAEVIWRAARIDVSTTSIRSLVVDDFDRLDPATRATMSALFDRMLRLGTYVFVGVSNLSTLSTEPPGTAD